MDLQQLAAAAKKASHALQSVSESAKDEALRAIHKSLLEDKEAILEANRLDISNAEKLVQNGSMSSALFKRLDLSSASKFESLLSGVLDVILLPDPTGKITLASKLDDGLELYRVSCPVGVLLVIFEARPEVVVQIAALAIKSGNAVILKGGKEASASNAALFKCIQRGLESLQQHNGSDYISADAVQLVSTRDEVSALLQLDKYIDLVIPRGSNQLVKHVQSSTRIPVLGHADGICSMFLHKDADLHKSIPVIVDSKTNYPAACNALETLLVHEPCLGSFLPSVAASLVAAGVQLRCDGQCMAVLGKTNAADIAAGNIVPSNLSDYDTEFLDLVIAVKSVASLQAAVEHINLHGSHHTDGILTQDEQAAKQFMQQVDSAGVYWNASTRFADGFRYGFGAEIGVSTNKTHARGPVGLEGLVIYKYRLYGTGQIVSEYNNGKKSYHRANIPFEKARHL